MTNLAEIGRFLRQARKDRAMTASELALKAGISRNTLGALEAGRGNVELNTLLALLRTPRAGDAVRAAGGRRPDPRRHATPRSTSLQDEVSSLMPRSRRSPRQARPDERRTVVADPAGQNGCRVAVRARRRAGVLPVRRRLREEPGAARAVAALRGRAGHFGQQPKEPRRRSPRPKPRPWRSCWTRPWT